jgi:hypothetical protein
MKMDITRDHVKQNKSDSERQNIACFLSHAESGIYFVKKNMNVEGGR